MQNIRTTIRSNKKCPNKYDCTHCQFCVQGKEKSGCIYGYKTTFYIHSKNLNSN